MDNIQLQEQQYVSIAAILQNYGNPFLKGNILLNNAIRHENAWKKVFKNMIWLNLAYELGCNPCLVGYDVEDLYNYNGIDQKRINLLLVSGHWDWWLEAEGITIETLFGLSEKAYECFRQSFNDYDYYEELGIFHIKYTNIYINVSKFFPLKALRHYHGELLYLANGDDIFGKDGLCMVLYSKESDKLERIVAYKIINSLYEFQLPCCHPLKWNLSWSPDFFVD